MAEEPLIRVNQLHYSYNAEGDVPIPALRGIDLDVHAGDFFAVVGHNGSGKSTLARCLNGLLTPTSGDVWVQGSNTREMDVLCDVRAIVGMVFQNPDNQFVSTVVEEEVAFGPENLGLPRPELRARVEEALAATALAELRGRNPRTLSAGQKARLAIATILAMQPRVLILDESTAMLDPVARRDVLALLRRLHAGGLTLIMITHFMDEVALAERALVLDHGEALLQGAPGEVFARTETLHALGLALPPAAAIARGLAGRGLPGLEQALTAEELQRALLAGQEVRRTKHGAPVRPGGE